MATVAKLFDGNILNKSKQQIDLNDEQYQGEVIGLYFSAHWFVSFYLIKFHFYYVLGRDVTIPIPSIPIPYGIGGIGIGRYWY